MILFSSVSAYAGDDAVANSTPQKDYVVLKVAGEEVNKSEIDAMLKNIFPGGNAPAFETFDAKIKDNILRGIASEHIIYSEAVKSNVAQSEEVKKKIAESTRQIFVQEFLKNKSKELATDEKLKALYEEKVKSNNQEEVHARHILLKKEEDAKEVHKKIINGGDFEKIAKEKSEDKGSGASGGDLGWFTADKMVAEFSKAAFAMKKGEISNPVKSDFGWHIIKLEDRRKAPVEEFEKMKPNLLNKVVSDYVAELVKHVKIITVDEKGVEKELTPEALPKDTKADK